MISFTVFIIFHDIRIIKVDIIMMTSISSIPILSRCALTPMILLLMDTRWVVAPREFTTLKYKKNINFLLSLLFLLPLCFVVGYYSIELINMAWKIKEVSTEAGGLGYVYIQKTLIILFPITLLLTMISQFIKNKWNWYLFFCWY